MEGGGGGAGGGERDRGSNAISGLSLLFAVFFPGKCKTVHVHQPFCFFTFV